MKEAELIAELASTRPSVPAFSSPENPVPKMGVKTVAADAAPAVMPTMPSFSTIPSPVAPSVASVSPVAVPPSPSLEVSGNPSVMAAPMKNGPASSSNLSGLVRAIEDLIVELRRKSDNGQDDESSSTSSKRVPWNAPDYERPRHDPIRPRVGGGSLSGRATHGRAASEMGRDNQPPRNLGVE